MDNIIRTIHAVLETNIPNYSLGLDDSKGMKAFQLVKYATGKKNSEYLKDYSYEDSARWYGFDTLTIVGKKGFIRLALTPLFEIVK